MTEKEKVTRTHIRGALSSYTGKTLTSDVLNKVTDDVLEAVQDAEKVKEQGTCEHE